MHESVVQNSGVAKANKASRAAQVFSEGRIMLIRCHICDSSTGAATAVFGNAADWWVVGRSGAGIVFINSSVYSDTLQGILSLSGNSEALFRGCKATNMAIDDRIAEGRLGIIDSTFTPALPASVRTVGPPSCGVSLAGQPPMCDPRAACIRKAEGGVACLCEGGGLSDKGSVPGMQCSRATSVETSLASSTLRLRLPKPGKSAPLALSVRAAGESSFVGSFSANVTLHRRSNGGDTVRGEGASAFGQLLNGMNSRLLAVDLASDEPGGSPYWNFDCELLLSINNCSDVLAIGCAEDGDAIESVLSFTDAADGALLSMVTIWTEVSAIVSCSRSSVKVVQSDKLLTPATRLLQIRLSIADVDGLPIRSTLPTAVVQWGSDVVPLAKSIPGSNQFEAFIPLGMRSSPGAYLLRLTVHNGWNGSATPVDCVLLETLLTVDDASDAQRLVVAGVVAALMACFIVLLLILVHRNKHKVKAFMISFMSFEGLLMIEICKLNTPCARTHTSATPTPRLTMSVCTLCGRYRHLGFRRRSHLSLACMRAAKR